MNNYEIVLKDKNTKKVHAISVDKISFAEAAQEAYLVKNKLGHSWKIVSINKKGEITWQD